jgi:cbb3-type cytochrome oxidase maturation protein
VFAYLIVSAMAVLAATAAVAFAWAAADGQFRHLSRAASSIFWDDAPEGPGDDG